MQRSGHGSEHSKGSRSGPERLPGVPRGRMLDSQDGAEFPIMSSQTTVTCHGHAVSMLPQHSPRGLERQEIRTFDTGRHSSMGSRACAPLGGGSARLCCLARVM